MLPPGRRILHYHEKHVLCLVDHDIASRRAVPFELAERTGRWGSRETGIDPHPEAIAEAKSVAGIVIVVARNAGARTDLICGHRLEGRGAEIGLAVERAAVEQH